MISDADHWKHITEDIRSIRDNVGKLQVQYASLEAKIEGEPKYSKARVVVLSVGSVGTGAALMAMIERAFL